MDTTHEMNYIHMKFLPHSARLEIADLLDPPNSTICMETFAEEVDKLFGYRLRFTNTKTQNLRYRYGERPTMALFKILDQHNVTIGHIQQVLNNMRAASGDIFIRHRQDILQKYASHMGIGTMSGERPRENECQCSQCPWLSNSSTPEATLTVPGDLFPSMEQAAVHGSVLQDGRLGRETSRHESDRERRRNSFDKNRNPERRVTPDPEETIPMEPSNQCRWDNIPNNIQSSRSYFEMSPSVGESVEQINTITFDQAPSVSLRDVPNISFQNGLKPDNHGITYPKQSVYSRGCICGNVDVSENIHQKMENTDVTKRYSDPTKYMSSCEFNLSHSSSDSSIIYPPVWKNPSRGKRILFTYTEDIKGKVTECARELKEDGYIVNTDLRPESYIQARNEGLVFEENQIVWLHDKYRRADHVIVCLSRGYLQCINSNGAIPSTQFLNAKYVLDLICEDPSRHDKIIVVDFDDSINSIRYFPFAPHYKLPQEIHSMKAYVNCKAL